MKQALVAICEEWGLDSDLSEAPVNRYAQAVKKVQATAQSSPVAISEPEPPKVSAVTSAPAPLSPAAGNAIPEFDTLSALDDFVRSYQGLAVCQDAQQPLISAGKAEATLLILGTAPASSADEAGSCFAGEQGQLLDNILAALGYDREDCYLTYTVPWRPAGDRKPSPEELRFASQLLEARLKFVTTPYLIVFGQQALSHVRPESLDKFKAIYRHPSLSFLLKQPQYKASVWQQLKEIKHDT